MAKKIREILGLAADATQEQVIEALAKHGDLELHTQEEVNAAAAAARKGSSADLSKDDLALLKQAKYNQQVSKLTEGIHSIKPDRKDKFVNNYLKDQDGNFIEKITPELMEKARKEEPHWFEQDIDPFTGQKKGGATPPKSTGGLIMSGDKPKE